MCLICDGWSPDEVLERQVSNIETRGFTMVSVIDAAPWTYSIGLRWCLEAATRIRCSQTDRLRQLLEADGAIVEADEDGDRPVGWGSDQGFCSRVGEI